MIIVLVHPLEWERKAYSEMLAALPFRLRRTLRLAPLALAVFISDQHGNTRIGLTKASELRIPRNRLLTVVVFYILQPAFCQQRKEKMQLFDVYVLHSPHFPLHYSNNMNCSWIFVADNDQGFFIIKPGNNIGIEEYDNLILGSGLDISHDTILYRYPRRVQFAPLQLSVGNSSMWVWFTSDKYTSLSGFYLLVERNEKQGVKCVMSFKILYKTVSDHSFPIQSLVVSSFE